MSEYNLRYFFAQWWKARVFPNYSRVSDHSHALGKFRARGTVKQNLEALRMPVELLLRAEGDNQQKTVRVEGRSEDFDFESNGQPIEVIVDPNNKILRMSDDIRVSGSRGVGSSR